MRGFADVSHVIKKIVDNLDYFQDLQLITMMMTRLIKINLRVGAGSVFMVIEQPFANNKNDEEDRDD